MFDFLNQLFEWLFKFVPRREIVPPDMRATRSAGSGKVRELPPGRYWWWPLMQEFRSVKTSQQLVKLPEQSVEAADGTAITTAWAIQYRVISPIKALYNIEDCEEAICGVAGAAIHKCIAGVSYTPGIDREIIGKKVIEEVRKLAGDWGVSIQKAVPLQYARGRVLRIFLDTGESGGRIMK